MDNLKSRKNTTILFDIVVFVFILTCFIFKEKLSNIINPIILSFWMLITFFYILVNGYRRNKKNVIKSRIMNIYFVSILVYLIVTYVIGFKTGYIKPNINTNSIINSIYIFFSIILEEVFRYCIVNKNQKDKKQAIISIVIFFVFDLLLLMPANLDIYRIIIYVLISLIKEVLLTYSTYKFGYAPNILYRLLLEFSPLLLFYPVLSPYVELMGMIALDLVIYYLISRPMRKMEMERADSYKKGIGFYLEIAIFIFVFILVALISGQFKYYLSSIASDSMYPALKRGDGIIIKKLTDEEKNNLQVGDIIAFYDGDVIVTHRIVRIDNGREIQFITKGDNNDTKDITKQKKDDIIGIVKIRIPLIGYPSIELNEMVNKRE